MNTLQVILLEVPPPPDTQHVDDEARRQMEELDAALRGEPQ